MINDQRYAILSLELHLFFSRIMKEHSLFLEAGFTPKDSEFAKRAEHYKNEFEKLLWIPFSKPYYITNSIFDKNTNASKILIFSNILFK